MLSTFVAGPYVGAWGGSSVGITRNGFRIRQESRAQAIDETDVYGLSTIDLVYRGGNVHIIWTGKEYGFGGGDSGSMLAFWPWVGVGGLGQMVDVNFPMGRMGSTMSQPLVLTVVAGSRAADNAAPTSLTAGKTILSPNNNLELIFNSELREVPVELQCLPYEPGNAGDPDPAGADIRWFELTI